MVNSVSVRSCQKSRIDFVVNSTISPLSNLFLNINYPILDSCITVEEIVRSILNCKSGRTPGIDGIGYEFYKQLPQNWL